MTELNSLARRGESDETSGGIGCSNADQPHSPLKTLKDLGFEKPIRINGQDLVDSRGLPYTLWWVNEILKQEAIKWVKHFDPHCNGSEIAFHKRQWIMHFFNITEEELK